MTVQPWEPVKGWWMLEGDETPPQNEDNQLGNVRQEVMRWLEQSGFQTGRGVMGERRKREKRVRVRSIIHRFEVAIDPETGPARDPWQALKGELS